MAAEPRADDDRRAVAKLLRTLQWVFTGAAVLWWLWAALVLWAAFTRSGNKLGAFLAIYLLLTVGASGVAFVMMMWDKWRAIRVKPRVSESTLLFCSLAGGWPGTQLARMLFRHKTQKVSFRAVYWLIISLHLLLLGYVWWSDWFRLMAQALIYKAPAA